MAANSQKISLLALTGMVVGSMIGAGIFNLPARFGTATGPFGAIIAWLIAGTGMFMLARVFQFLAEKKPEIDAGVFAYAKAGFGDYMGFLSAFGYWLGSCLGNVFYWVLIGTTLGKFFPIFGAGNTEIAILVSLAGIWSFHFMILRGVEQAAFINSVVTVAKIVPIIVALIFLVLAFNYDQFAENFFGGVGMPEKTLVAQVRDTMLITVFVFLGIEGASVYSRFAKTRADVGRATILGFVGVTGLMVAVTLLPYAAMPRAEIAALRQPSLASTLAAVVGPWGSVFIAAGVLISVLGAYLAWSLICAEVLFAAAKSKDMPRLFAAENGNYMGRPVGRHIIFMTDGEMNTPRTNYSHQGLEQVMQRIGATDNADAIARHTNRLGYLCSAAKQKGIVVWIIGFGVDLDDPKNAKLVACASSGKAYEAGSSAQLASIFSQIAQQISRLRLSQ